MCLFFKDFIYLFERERVRVSVHISMEREADEREKQTPLSREPDDARARPQDPGVMT